MSFTTRSQEASTLGSDFAFEACVVAAEQLTSMLGTEGVGSGWTVTSADRSPFRPIHAAAKWESKTCVYFDGMENIFTEIAGTQICRSSCSCCEMAFG